MIKEIQIIRYLLDEIEERENKLKDYKTLDDEAYKKKYGHPKWGYYRIAPKQMVIDNTKKIRQLALKVGKRV